MGNAVNAYSKGGKSGLSSGSILALASGTLKHFTFLPLVQQVRSSGGRVGLVLTTLNMSSEVPGFDFRHLQTAFKLTGLSECCSGHFVFG